MRYPVIAIDIETTGLDPRRNGICEVAAVAMNAEGKRDVYRSDVHDVTTEIDPEALTINGFTRERLEAAPLLSKVLYDLKLFLAAEPENSVAIFHNAPFDLSFLKQAYSRWHMPEPKQFRRVVDTATIGYMLLVDDDAGIPSLELLCDVFEVENTAPHTALGDATATLDVFEAMMSAHRFVTSMGIQTLDAVKALEEEASQ